MKEIIVFLKMFSITDLATPCRLNDSTLTKRPSRIRFQGKRLLKWEKGGLEIYIKKKNPNIFMSLLHFLNTQDFHFVYEDMHTPVLWILHFFSPLFKRKDRRRCLLTWVPYSRPARGVWRCTRHCKATHTRLNILPWTLFMQLNHVLVHFNYPWT